VIADALIIFIFGLVIGSFLNVLIYRVPRHKSIVTPPSHCARCGSTLKWYDNIPVISFMLLKGRCRSCGEPISAIYPVVELFTAIIFLVLYLKFSLTLLLIKYLLFASLLIALSGIDFYHYILPDVLAYPLIAIGLIFAFFNHNTLLLLLDAFGVSLFLFLLGIVVGKSTKKEALGFGDVKLIFAITLFLGIKGAVFTLFVGSVLGIAASVFIFRQNRIPFGPFLSAAALLSIFLSRAVFAFFLG